MTGSDPLFPGAWERLRSDFLEPDRKQALIGVTNADKVAEVDLLSMSVVRRLSTGKGPAGMARIAKQAGGLPE